MHQETRQKKTSQKASIKCMFGTSLPYHENKEKDTSHQHSLAFACSPIVRHGWLVIGLFTGSDWCEFTAKVIKNGTRVVLQQALISSSHHEQQSKPK
jgi:hypothetical protein